VWDAVALKPLYIVYSTFDIGDVFSVVYSQALQTIYLGAQNTSIQVHPLPELTQWYDLKEIPARPRTSSSSFPMRRFNKFFDTQKKDETSPDQSDVDDDGSVERIPLLEIEPRNQVQFAHYGYVYCLLLGTLPHSSEELLFSGTPTARLM
jgi:di- and tripeptidase